MTNKDEILNEFKKYADFRHSKRLVITGLIHPAKNKEIFYINNYCDFKMVAVMKELRKIGLEQEFIKRYFKN